MIQEYAAHYQSQRNLLIVISLIAIALAIGACVMITRAVTGPLRFAIDVARTVSQGDLRTRITVDGNDETSRLLSALREMNERLTAIVGRVRDSSTSIAGAARQIAAGNMDLSQRTEQQAASLQETASSMEQLTSTVKQNADNAQQGSMLAANASSVAQKGSAVVGQVVEHDARHQRKLDEDRGHHGDHRRHCVPDEHPGAERGRRSRARGRTGTRLRGGRERSAEASRNVRRVRRRRSRI